MGRHRKIEEDKKVKIGISVDPDIPIFFKDKHINISSLVNKLLRDYINNGKEKMY